MPHNTGADAAWYYELDGQRVGPLPAAEIRDLVAAGRLPGAALVWTTGMPSWVALSSVPELLPLPPLSATELAPVSPGAVIALSIVTFGIYGLVKFYQAAKLYQRLARAQSSSFDALFWSYVACGFLGGLTIEVGIGVPLVIAEIVVGVFTLNEVLSLRARAVSGNGLSPGELTSDSTHRALWLAGAIGTWILVGLIPLIIQVAKFFGDHEAVLAALRSRGAAARALQPPSPAATASPPALAPPPPAAPRTASFCTSCGAERTPGARFCAGCGAPIG